MINKIYPLLLLIAGFCFLAGCNSVAEDNTGQNSKTGRVENYTFSVSRDGESWQKVRTGQWDSSPELKEVQLSRSLEAKFVRLEVQSAYNSTNTAAIAEIGLILK